AEFCMMAMLMHYKQALPMLRNQQRRRWERFAGTDLEGRTLAIVGLGHIGNQVAQMACGLGMTVIGTNAAEPEPCVERLFPPERLLEMLPLADVLVLATPHTPQTEKMIGKPELDLLKPGAYLINIARGAVVDEPALIEALRDGRLGGAALDVFEQEPLPETSPLWDMENVLVNPHSASTSDRENERLTDLFCDNLQRFVNGQPLRNVLQPDPILSVENLVTHFHTPEGVIHAVNGVSFALQEGETLAVVGESGCGKSVTMLSVLQLIPQPPGKVEAGRAIFEGQDLLQMSREEIRRVRGAKIAMIFQDPMTSLNPVLTIEKQASEQLMVHMGMNRAQARQRVVELLKMVGLPEAERRLTDYPHQFSGGMRQRVMIAMALACNPQILVADEPTTALDVTIQAQIVELVKRLRNELGMAIIWITHDLGVVTRLAQRVMVLYAGYIIEEAPVKELYANPQHPYTLGLLNSLPRLDSGQRRPLVAIQGRPPLLREQPTYCPFAPRCAYAFDRCWKENPALLDSGPNHRVACWWDVQEGQARHG
ncbi:MAG: oligopeptide/dipeptide ABC transporter ATP-binding protein, partial [Anaerolineales bacterium]